MAVRPHWFAIPAACLLPFVAGCGSGDDSIVPVPDSSAAATASYAPKDSTSESTAADASLSPDAGDGNAEADAILQMVPPTVGLLRVANWSPGAPAVDACLAPHGTGTFTGPVVAALAASEDASTHALAFPSVSAYIEMTPGQYDVRFVVGGATSCAVGVVGDATLLPSVAAGAAETVALMGEANPTGGDAPLRVVGFLDDVSASAVALRFVNAAPSVPNLDVGMGTLASTNFAALFTGIPFGQHGSAQEAPSTDASMPNVDGNGYVSLKTLSGATLSAHAHGASVDLVSTTGVTATSGSVLTIAVVAESSSGAPASLIECVDNSGTVGPLSNCFTLP